MSTETEYTQGLRDGIEMAVSLIRAGASAADLVALGDTQEQPADASGSLDDGYLDSVFGLGPMGVR